MADNAIIALSTKMTDETPWTSSWGQIWSQMSFNMQAQLKGRGAYVDDPILQGWKNWTIRLTILD
jgi:hypothetical protein